MQFSSIWLIDRTLSGATSPGQKGPGSDGYERVLRFPQSSSITGASSSDYLMSYPGYSLGGVSYPSAEVQSVYSTAPADWAVHVIIIILSCHQHGYHWIFLVTSPYRSIGPQGYTQYLYKAAVCRFELVALHLLGHVKGSIGVHHLWGRPYFSGRVLHVWFV